MQYFPGIWSSPCWKHQVFYSTRSRRMTFFTPRHKLVPVFSFCFFLFHADGHFVQFPVKYELMRMSHLNVCRFSHKIILMMWSSIFSHSCRTSPLPCRIYDLLLPFMWHHFLLLCISQHALVWGKSLLSQRLAASSQSVFVFSTALS